MKKKRDKIIYFFASTFIMLLIANITSGLAQLASLGLGFLLLVLSIKQVMATWRCPRCDKFLGKISFKEVPTHCKDCGKKL